MNCKDCANKSKCKNDKTEVCNDFKAKKSKLKKILAFTGIVLGSSAVAAFVGYKKGNEDKNELAINFAKSAMNELRNRTLAYAENGDFASEITKDDGSIVYLNYTVSDTAPEWWDKEDTNHFDLKEEIIG